VMVDARVREAVHALVRAIEYRAPHVGEHSRAVSNIARHLGAEMALPREQIDLLTIGALLHDVGKIGLPDSILSKPGVLTEEEREIVRRHPVLGAEIVEPVRGLSSVLPTIKHHHERFDGKGYPDGLRGEDIPFAARLVFVADALDSMVRDRPYRFRLSEEDALEEIVRNSGTQFDPDIVRALVEMVRESDSWRISSAG
jgi:putative nucleotidyltransferase with HDIG domain